MSNKFTGITSAGSAIPVYDKDAHSALSAKLDTSAFSSVSGEFATVDDVVAAVSGKADTSAIPSLDGYATQEWVGEQGYLTEVPESAVSGFATHEEVVEATSGKMDVSGLASGQVWGEYWNPPVYSAYNGIPFYAGDKLDKSAATAVSPNFNQNNNQNMGYAKFSGWNQNVGIDISGAHTNKRIYITDSGMILSGYSSQPDAQMHANAHVLDVNADNYVDGTLFKNIYRGKDGIYVVNDIKTVSGNYDTQYYNYSFIGDFSGNGNLSKEFTVTLPVATTSVTYTAAEQDWNWLYIGTLTSDTPNTVWKIQPDRDYTAKKADHELNTATFYTFQITQSPFPSTGGVVSASILSWNDEVFATRPWVEEQLSANVPQGVMQTSGLEYDGDKISGYMGSAFKAGDELPSGVMVESAFNYNDSNRITGYNGSAFAQGGGADLDFGYDESGAISSINTSALSDSRAGDPLYVEYPLFTGQSGSSAYIGWNNETVLYENYAGRPITTGSYIDLSESPLNFEYVEVYLNGSTPSGTGNIANGYEKIPNYQLRSVAGLEFIKLFAGSLGSTSTIHEMGCGYSGTSGTRWTKWFGYAKAVTGTGANFDNATHLNIWKVVGVGRYQ